MSKPTYYLLNNDFSTPEDYEKAKENYRRLGFRVITYQDGPKGQNIHQGLKAIIKNHCNTADN